MPSSIALLLALERDIHFIFLNRSHPSRFFFRCRDVSGKSDAPVDTRSSRVVDLASSDSASDTRPSDGIGRIIVVLESRSRVLAAGTGIGTMGEFCLLSRETGNFARGAC